MDGELEPETLARLAKHFKDGNAVQAIQRGITHPSLEKPRHTISGVEKFRISGLAGNRLTVGTDGSYNSEHNLGSFAAVHGDGYVTTGLITGDTVSSTVAEMYGVLAALRGSGVGSVALMMDNTSVIDVVRAMINTGQIPQRTQCDPNMLGEIAGLLQHRNLHLYHVPDIEGGTNPSRIPSHPLMAIAHRASWVRRRMHEDGIDVNSETRRILIRLAQSTSRQKDTFRRVYLRHFGAFLT